MNDPEEREIAERCAKDASAMAYSGMLHGFLREHPSYTGSAGSDTVCMTSWFLRAALTNIDRATHSFKSSFASTSFQVSFFVSE